jgi:signal peptide peptidase SppA
MGAKRGRTTARRLISSILSTPWFIREGWLQEFAGFAEEARLRADQLTAEEVRERLRAALSSMAPDEKPESLAVSMGVPLGPGLSATLRDGVAIIPIIGPLYHYASEFDDVCGCSSYQQIARDLDAALASPDVGAILFEVDSPGGEVAGAAELSQMMYDARGVKPTASYVSDLGASAGYYAASSAEVVVIARSAVLGSIGVVMTYLDTSERDSKSGVRRVEILSSQSPEKRADPNTDSGRAQIQQMLDDLAQVFVDDVARNRGVSVETVLSDFGRGSVMVGDRAVAAGLADRVGSFEALLAELAEKAAASSGAPVGSGTVFSTPTQELTMNENPTPPAAEDKPVPVLTADSVATDHPEIAATLRAAGAEAERARILGIEDLSIAGHETLIRQCKEDGACTVEMAGVRLIKAVKAAPAPPVNPGSNNARSHLTALAGAESELDPPAPTAGATDPNSVDAQVARIVSAGKPATSR